MPIEYPPPPPLTEFAPYKVPGGRVWDPNNRQWDTRDNGCVAVSMHASGYVALADTKVPVTAACPLIFTGDEWDNFLAEILAGGFRRHG